jgi:DNA polymerase I-like protein with 3'-5' exonuclease and polymerase domains
MIPAQVRPAAPQLGGTQDLAALERSTIVYFDCETTGLAPTQGGLRLLQFFARGVDAPLVLDCWDFDKADWKRLRAFCDQPRSWVAHNAVFDVSWLQEHGVHFFPGRVYCTMLASVLVWNGKPNVRHSLAELFHRITGDDVDKELQRSNWAGEITAEQLLYAANDVRALRQLYSPLTDMLKHANLMRAWSHECAALQAVAQMQRHGLTWDVPRLRELGETLAAEAEQMKADFLAQAQVFMTPGVELNLKSPKQMLRVFTEALGYEPKGPDGRPSTSKPALEPLRGENPVVDAFLSYRRHVKGAQMATALIGHCDEEARTRASYRQLGAETGRFSCVEPNLQQIPRDPRFRACVVARPGYRLVVADYSQMELRLAAVEAKDRVMVEAFCEGQDLHTLTARAIYKVDEPSKAQRQVAKSANFGLLYGAGARGLKNYAATMGIEMTLEEANTIRNTFLELYSGIAAWHKDAAFEQELSAKGCGQWPFVRIRRTRLRRFLKGDANQMTRRLNTVIQGAGAAVLKETLGALWLTLHRTPEEEAVLLATVHDEIIMSVREDAVERWVSILQETMETIEAEWLELGDGRAVPPAADAHSGLTWLDAK